MKKNYSLKSLATLFAKDKYDKTLGKNLPVMFREKVKKCPDTDLQISKNEVGEYDHFSYQRVYRHVIEMACVLKELGVKKGDHVGLISDNRKEWLVTDLAVLSLGACDVPRGCDSMGTEIRFILNFVGCDICFFENQKQFEKIFENISEIPPLKYAVLYDSPDEEMISKAAGYGITVLKYIELEDNGRKADRICRAEIERGMDDIASDDLATIIFTSGTTGNPKGVMLTHDNFLAQCEVFKYAFRYPKRGDIWLSILPIWHVFERAFCYGIIALENSMAYSKPSVSYMLSDMQSIHPQWMIAVPRLWESCEKSFFRDMKKKGKLVYMGFTIAVSIGTSYHWAVDRVFGLRCRYKNTFRFAETLATIIPYLLLWPVNGLCELTYFRKLRAIFGGKMIAAVSGGGSLQPEVADFYTAIGFKILQGYGMTETAPIISMCDPAHLRTGCVGRIFPSMEAKIVAEDNGVITSSEPLKPGKKGVIMARGRQIMKGYYKRPDLTGQIIDSGGWLNTGDIGMLTQDSEIKFVGRAKDTIVLMGGENIEPAVIEEAVCRSKFVENAVIVGQDQKYIAALIVPLRDTILQYADEERIMYANYEMLLESNEIKKLIQDEIDRQVNASAGFRTCERIYKFALLSESFQVGRELNPKMTIIRPKVIKLYTHEIKALYK